MQKQNILWLDCIGGLVAGILILIFRELISDLDSLPIQIIVLVGFTNLVYGSFSLWVTTRIRRPARLIRILATANIFWLAVCLTIVVLYWREISLFGTVHKIGEGVYVAFLGFLELKWLQELTRKEKSGG